jgi:hypothetical protein
LCAAVAVLVTQLDDVSAGELIMFPMAKYVEEEKGFALV